MPDDFLSDEDKAMFRAHMQSVKPLKKHLTKVKTIKQPVKNIKIPTKKTNPERTIDKKEFFLSDFISDPLLSESNLSFYKPIVSSKQFRALKNGKIPWEAQLDLHGFQQEAAREALIHFIQTQSKNHKRCLLIIHGKGGHQGAPPIIKNLVNRWLPQFDEVSAFHSAQAKNGGHGAVYVLLKKSFNEKEGYY